MITLKKQHGKTIVTVDNVTTVFDTLGEALEYIFKERGLLE